MSTGPSTSTLPYLLPATTKIRFTSVVTAGDQLPPGGSLFAGSPDGLGAFDNGDGTITVLINHELSKTAGIVRAHGSVGAFVDRFVIDKTTLQVVSSGDLIQSVYRWSDSGDRHYLGTTAFDRLCSGDLAGSSAFFNPATGLGTEVRIWMTGEEAGGASRAFATLVSGPGAGTAYELPWLGNMSFENVVASPFTQDKTVVAVTDDIAGGQVYIYIGDKTAEGSDIAKAGLIGGQFFGIKVEGVAAEVNGSPANGSFTLQAIGPDGDASNMTGSQIEAESDAEGVTGFLRPEDIAWDPDNPGVLYFTTTNSYNGNSRLYKLTFTDISNPALGGTIEAVLAGGEGQKMLDNLTVANGKIILQEDPGNVDALARVWEYDIATDSLSLVASFDPGRFTPGVPGFIDNDEESSGVLDVTQLLGDADTRAYLLTGMIDAQSGNPATVKLGQLMVMFVDDAAAATPLIGRTGNDQLAGTDSGESLVGNEGDDQLLAGLGGDALFGGTGNDHLYGEDGDDFLYGQRGADQLFGGAENDRLDGGKENDRLDGGAGDDWVEGRDNGDQLTGGDGADRFVFDNRVSTGNDVIRDFGSEDLLLSRVALSDPDGDGIITFGATLALSSKGAVDINNGAANINQLSFAGTVEMDGAIYYSYKTEVEASSQLFDAAGLHPLLGFRPALDFFF